MNDVKPLSAEAAGTLMDVQRYMHAELAAIASGQHVVVPVMTEAEALRRFRKEFKIKPLWHERAIWLAALRSVGVVK